MIRLGLVGFGRTGKVVSREIIDNKVPLVCVFRKSDKYVGHDIGHLLGFEDEIGVKMANINEMEQVLDETKPDVLIDFSSKEAVKEFIPVLAKKNIGLVICSTGWEKDEVDLLKSYSDKMGIVMATNITEGINILISISKLVKQLWPDADIEIIETHFSNKKDISGTSLRIASAINNHGSNNEIKVGRKKDERRVGKEIVVHSVRSGGVVGKHEIIFGKPHQSISITHESIDRSAFGRGAVRAAKWVNGERGFHTMEDVLNWAA